MKIRVIGNPIFVDMANAIGANGVAMGYDQVFSALQTGVIDGAENNAPSFVFDNHYQVAKFYSNSQHLIVPEMLVYSKKSFATLSADDQATIKKLSRDAQADARVLWDKKEDDAYARMKAANIELDTIADKKPFVDAVKPVWDKYGAKFTDLIKRINAVT
jgi:TRAP-type C4-dicarboxylate transport system substrate-binding protein